MPMCRHLLLAALPILMASCATTQNGLNYTITTKSHYLCCRTIRYATWDFPKVKSSGLQGDGVVVRLEPVSSSVKCDSDLEVRVAIANNGDHDVFIPISYELQGDTLLLYPFRGGWVGPDNVRIARQLQYGDIVDREIPRLQFYRLPRGREVRLIGIVPRKWLCSQTIPANDEYLAHESTNTDFFVNRSKPLGALPYRRDPDLRDTFRLRFDVGYSRLDFYEAYPILERTVNRAADSVSIRIAVDDQPKELLDEAQQVAFSNVISLNVE